MTRRQEEELFETALGFTDAAARRTFLAAACRGDDALLARLEGLLAAHENSEKFFTNASPVKTSVMSVLAAAANHLNHSTPDHAETVEEAPGTQIGPYKLLQRLGEGGGGVVYRAEQNQPVRRQVALKIIKLGMDTKSVIARFEAERQALAMMNHPYIASVLDAGATETGRPYFVMELVSGVKITDYCDQNHLHTRQRLDLFVQICHAIQHAHQKGIIHRDIKPANILVTLHDGVPVPKVIDFGIAKAIAGRLTDKTLFTACEQFIGTPAYMSPEQAEMSGLDVDTRSDIYSLGVLLYELLTGRTPFDPKKLLASGFHQMRDTLRETEPQRPSTMLTTLTNADLAVIAAHRQIQSPRLISELKGDLDWIVLKCLEKDRLRRYETANGLAMDVQRYLGHEPVVARPPSRAYRFQKLIRRNRALFAALGMTTAALLLGLGTSTWLFFMERDARQRAVAAEQQQIRLREQAERARAQENELRLQAEMREKLTQAAVLIEKDQIETADRIIGSATPPQQMLEGVNIFRTLGDWNALRNRWRPAADRLEMLVHVGQFESEGIVTLDCTRCSCALMEAGDAGRYARFRTTLLQRFAGTTDPISAERVVKVCLLAPAPPPVMDSLRPLAQFAAASFSNTNVANWMLPWRAASLALWEYRCGHWNESAAWAARYVESDTDTGARTATARVLLSMACQQLGQTGKARTQLAAGMKLLKDHFRGGFAMGDGNSGFWFDWKIAQILAREASPLIPLDPPPPDIRTLPQPK